MLTLALAKIAQASFYYWDQEGNALGNSDGMNIWDLASAGFGTASQPSDATWNEADGAAAFQLGVTFPAPRGIHVSARKQTVKETGSSLATAGTNSTDAAILNFGTIPVLSSAGSGGGPGPEFSGDDGSAPIFSVGAKATEAEGLPDDSIVTRLALAISPVTDFAPSGGAIARDMSLAASLSKFEWVGLASDAGDSLETSGIGGSLVAIGTLPESIEPTTTSGASNFGGSGTAATTPVVAPVDSTAAIPTPAGNGLSTTSAFVSIDPVVTSTGAAPASATVSVRTASVSPIATTVSTNTTNASAGTTNVADATASVSGGALVSENTDSGTSSFRGQQPSGASNGDVLFVTNFAGKIDKVPAAGGTPSVVAAASVTPPVVNINNPQGLAFSLNGTLYVANFGNSTIEKFSQAGADLGTFATSAAVNQPCGLAFDSAGNLYVANQGNNTIEKITPAGGATVFYSGTGGNPALTTPSGLAFDRLGNLYVANNLGDSIVKITPAGVGTVFASGAGILNGPEGLAFDAAGNLYAANGDSNTIEEFNSTGTTHSLFASGLSVPEGLAFDAAGDLFVANSGVANIEEIAVGGSTSVFSQFSGSFNAPIFLAFTDSSGVPLSLPIPEPNAVASLLLAGGWLLGRRRRCTWR